MDRRIFLIFTTAAVLTLKHPKTLFAAKLQARDAIIHTYIPGRIFFSNRKAGVPVFLGALKLIDGGKTVSASFTNGHVIQYGSNSSSLTTLHKNKSRYATRKSILSKSLAAWVIDAVWKSINNKRNPRTAAQLSANFEDFQSLSVLEAVTPASLFWLVQDTAKQKQINQVMWSRELLRFEIE